jgi:hypothetical protein
MMSKLSNYSFIEMEKRKICHTNYVTFVGLNNLQYNDCASPKCRAGKISDNHI